MKNVGYLDNVILKNNLCVSHSNYKKGEGFRFFYFTESDDEQKLKGGFYEICEDKITKVDESALPEMHRIMFRHCDEAHSIKKNNEFGSHVKAPFFIRSDVVFLVSDTDGQCEFPSLLDEAKYENAGVNVAALLKIDLIAKKYCKIGSLTSNNFIKIKDVIKLKKALNKLVQNSYESFVKGQQIDKDSAKVNEMA